MLLAALLDAFDEAIYGAINEARPVTIKLGVVMLAALLLPYDKARTVVKNLVLLPAPLLLYKKSQRCCHKT